MAPALDGNVTHPTLHTELREIHIVTNPRGSPFRKLERMHSDYMDEKDRKITEIYNQAKERARCVPKPTVCGVVNE